MKKYRRFLLLMAFLPSFSLIQAQEAFEKLELKDLNNHSVWVSPQMGQKATVFFFLSSDCPLCENYSVTINELRKEFSTQEVVFVGVFTGKYVINKDVKKYLAEFKPEVNVVLDPEYILSKQLGATITPEVFAFNHQGDVFYQGKIDNWLASLGKYRTNITRHYLKDALTAELSGEPISLTKTQAVGCFIE